MRRYLFYSILLIIGHLSLKGQEKIINQNGFNRFFYPNGQVSSEGNMVDGSPDGYWRTYYVSGVLKSEGNRKSQLWIVYGCFIASQLILLKR